jgi:hypothetical protein
MSPVEQLVKCLSEVQSLLSELPNDAFAERSALLAKRAELQARAELHSAGADKERSNEDLRHELATLRLECARRNGRTESVRVVERIERLATILAERGSIGR